MLGPQQQYKRLARVAVVLVGLGLMVQLGLARTAAHRLEERQQAALRLSHSVVEVVEQQRQLVPRLVALGADAALLERSAVPIDRPIDETLELAIDLQRTLELEHAAVVPSQDVQLSRWLELDEVLSHTAHTLQQLERALQQAEPQAPGAPR